MARIERVQRESDFAGTLERLGLTKPVPVVVLVGSAAGLSVEQADAITPILERVVVPLCEELGAALVDGGTDSGVMSLVGRAHARVHANFPLVGVAAVGTIVGNEASVAEPAELEPNHTYVILVPGGAWGDESPWIAKVTRALARGRSTAGVLLGGGDISRRDVRNLVDAQSPVFVIAGSGRLADALCDVGRSGDPGVEALRDSPHVVPVRAIDNPHALDSVLRRALG